MALTETKAEGCMKNPIAIVIAEEPSAEGQVFGVIKSVHRSEERAEKAYNRAGASSWMVELVVEAKPGDRIRIDELRELVITRIAPD